MTSKTKRTKSDLAKRITDLEKQVELLTITCKELQTENKILKLKVGKEDQSVHVSQITIPVTAKSVSTSPTVTAKSVSTSPIQRHSDSGPGSQSNLQPNPVWTNVKHKTNFVANPAKNAATPKKNDLLPLQNRFSALSPCDKEEAKCIILGDSNVHRLKSVIIPKVKSKNVKVLSKSGADLTECEKQAMAEVKLLPKETPVNIILHAGSNDIPKTRCPEMLAKIRSFIQKLKEQRKNCKITICSIPNRFDKGVLVNSRIACVNESLPALCQQEGATSLLIHQRLRASKHPVLTSDRLHYNVHGANLVGSWICESANHFLGIR